MLPKVGSTVMTADGEGRVRQVHPLREVVSVKLEDGMVREYPVADLGEQSGPVTAPSGCSGCAMRRSPKPSTAAATASEDYPLTSDPDGGAELADPAHSRRRRNRRPDGSEG